MNCILLPAANFSQSSAYIDTNAHIEHIINVLRLKVGDTLKMGQIGGSLGTALIETIAVDKIKLCEVKLELAPPAKLNVTVILALPRPKVLRRLIMDMTAIGVNHIILINSYRTQKSYWQSPMLSRLNEFMLEGLQQGVDTIAPQITLEPRFKPFVEDKLSALIIDHAIVAHPYSQRSLHEYLQDIQNSRLVKSTSDTLISSQTHFKMLLPSVVCIGSEGGWIDYEIELLSVQGCQAVNIGSRVLRTEAAVNVILGQWLLQR